MDVRSVSVADLERRYGAAARPAPRLVIETLAADPRIGARRLAARLAREREARDRENRRLQALGSLESRLRKRGFTRVAGVDEVGVGPLAGPVVAAAVVLPVGVRLLGLDDSKRLRRKARERLDREIRAAALGVAVGWATPTEIDRLNVYRAGVLAMRRAVEALAEPPQWVVVDGRSIPGLGMPQHPVVGGDGRVAAIAAASVVAKVYRDAWMRDLHRRHPGYGFDRNAGYGTREHLRALRAAGPSPVHRMSFAPVRVAGPVRGTG